MLEEIKGNVLDEQLLVRNGIEVIAHQTNCVSKGAAGLALAMFKKWPEVDIYSHRLWPSTPGNCVMDKTASGLWVAHLMGQKHPGGPRHGSDSPAWRQRRFWDALEQLHHCMVSLADGPLTTVAFPKGIGCGLAGGSWKIYRDMLERWADVPGRTVYLIERT